MTMWMQWGPEIGFISLLTATLIAVMQALIPGLGIHWRRPLWVASAVPFAYAQWSLLVVAYGALTLCFLYDNFSVTFVAEHSNTHLPWYYKVCAVWGGHEGSVLLWALMLAGWGMAVARFGRRLPVEMQARVLSVLGVVATGFLLFIVATSNPFARLLPFPPLEGVELNPLLQDIGLIVHPPMLYMGYVGFSVAFAFAIAALWRGTLDAAWTRWVRPWTNLAWAFLTVGIALGSWWAYYELGWGGWWFWDPVENASLMPWLTGTALIHSLAATEKRGGLKRWTLLLALASFALSLLGTFLVRSGVLTSVHAFSNDPSRGTFILILLSITVGASLVLYAWRAPRLIASVDFAPVSRDTLLLINSVLMLVMTLTVLLGTLYPLALDSLGLGRISVGPPYFNAIFVPLGAALGVAMGWGPLVRWKRMPLSTLAARVGWIIPVSLLLGSVIAWRWAQGWSAPLTIAWILACWVVLPFLRDLVLSVRAAGLKGLRRLSRSYYGMLLGHVGFAMTLLGIVIVSNTGVERNVRMTPGTATVVAGYEFTLTGLRQQRGPNYLADVATVRAMRDGRLVGHLYPEKRLFLNSRQVMTETALDAGFMRDLYVALGEPLDNGQAWAVRIQVKPCVRWIWAGGVLMALGGGLAVLDRRYRRQARQQQLEKAT